MKNNAELQGGGTTDIKMSLYDLNKQAMKTFESMEKKDLCKKLSEMGDWFSYEPDVYFMLLCHEMRDYTILHFKAECKKVYEATTCIYEVLANRGSILAIDFVNDSRAYCIWIRDFEDEVRAYYLFPYDIGVEEI